MWKIVLLFAPPQHRQTDENPQKQPPILLSVIPGMGEGQGWGQGDLNLCSGDFLQSQGHSRLTEGTGE